MRILAIDPGNVESAYIVLESGIPIKFGKVQNDEMLNYVEEAMFSLDGYELVIEMVASYGMAVGKTIFDTCVWVGRFWQNSEAKDKTLIYRMDIKNHLCHSSRAKDANVRQALIDRFGGIQETKKGGRLYGIKSDMWAALAVACTYHDQRQAQADAGRTGD